MNEFAFNTTPSLRFGAGVFDQIGEIASKELGLRILLVTDPGILHSGIVDRALKLLKSSGVETAVYSDVKADPPESVVIEATQIAVKHRSEGVIGLGGGSSLDVAKLAALLTKSNQSLSDIYGIGNAKGPRLPLALIPTTAGTGSEVTAVSIVTTGSTTKTGVVTPLIIPDIAILDPELTLQLPPHTTAATGIDAMVHAIEAYTSASPNNNPISRSLAIDALHLLGSSIETAVSDGSNIEARSNMLLGSMLAGQAFANSPVAAVHALAYPLGGFFKVTHGLSNALVLPHVLRFNSVTIPQRYATIAPHVFPNIRSMSSQETAQTFAENMANLSERCGLQQKLRDVGVEESDLPMLAKEAMKQTRLLVNNPREVLEADALAIYKAAW